MKCPVFATHADNDNMPVFAIPEIICRVFANMLEMMPMYALHAGTINYAITVLSSPEL